jgi:uncharacterized protein (TIGR02246 family)
MTRVIVGRGIFQVRKVMGTERVEAADVTQIYKLWNEYSAAITSGDLEQWISLWCDNGLQMPPGAPQCSGKEQIQKLVQAQLIQSHTKLSIHPDVVCVLGDQAYSHGTFSFLLITGEGGAAKHISGKFLSVLKKQDDGSWKILMLVFCMLLAALFVPLFLAWVLPSEAWFVLIVSFTSGVSIAEVLLYLHMR